MKRIFSYDHLLVDSPSRYCILAGRAFFLMAALLLAVMPLTAWFWQFDNFLRGGQDFELGLLAVLSIFCLLIVLLQRRRVEVTIVLALNRWLTCLFNTRRLFAVRTTALSPILHPCSASTRLLRAGAMPLLV